MCVCGFFLLVPCFCIGDEDDLSSYYDDDGDGDGDGDGDDEEEEAGNIVGDEEGWGWKVRHRDSYHYFLPINSSV